jgi:hypothetical protein
VWQALFGFEVVGPCVANYNAGKTWLKEFNGNCSALYGSPGCAYDYSCIHLYYQPEDVANLFSALEAMHSDWGKDIWITELACPPYQVARSLEQDY